MSVLEHGSDSFEAAGDNLVTGPELLGLTSELPDQELVIAFQHGESDAFNVLYRRHHPAVTAQCRSRLRDPHLVEEAVQETFTRLLRKLPTFEGGKVAHYLSRTSLFVCRDLTTRHGQHRELTDATTARLASPDHADDVTTADGAARLLASLTDKQAMVLTRRYLHDQSAAAVAEELATSTNALGVMVFRAKGRARAAAKRLDVTRLLPLPPFDWLRTYALRLQLLPHDRMVGAIAAAIAVTVTLGATTAVLTEDGSTPVTHTPEPTSAAAIPLPGAVDASTTAPSLPAHPSAAPPVAYDPEPTPAEAPAYRQRPAVAEVPSIELPAGRRVSPHGEGTPDYDYRLGNLAGGPTSEPLTGIEIRDEHERLHDVTCPAIAALEQTRIATCVQHQGRGPHQ